MARGTRARKREEKVKSEVQRRGKTRTLRERSFEVREWKERREKMIVEKTNEKGEAIKGRKAKYDRMWKGENKYKGIKGEEGKGKEKEGK